MSDEKLDQLPDRTETAPPQAMGCGKALFWWVVSIAAAILLVWICE